MVSLRTANITLRCTNCIFEWIHLVYKYYNENILIITYVLRTRYPIIVIYWHFL